MHDDNQPEVLYWYLPGPQPSSLPPAPHLALRPPRSVLVTLHALMYYLILDLTLGKQRTQFWPCTGQFSSILLIAPHTNISFSKLLQPPVAEHSCGLLTIIFKIWNSYVFQKEIFISSSWDRAILNNCSNGKISVRVRRCCETHHCLRQPTVKPQTN